MIINLTNHKATPEQRAAGVVDLPDIQRATLAGLLTFTELPQAHQIYRRADDIAGLAVFNGLGGEHYDPWPTYAMIGGAPYLMAPLIVELRKRDIAPLFAFAAHESAEQAQPDGSVRTVAVFRHVGFVEAV